MSGGAPSKLLQFLAAGAIVAVSSWDVHRKIRANSVPVTAEQWEDINQWKKQQKGEILQGRSFRVLEYLSKGGGGEEGVEPRTGRMMDARPVNVGLGSAPAQRA